MKARTAIFAAAAVALAACDGEKAQEAKKETGEAAEAIGEAAKEIGGKAKEGIKSGVEKAKALAGAAKEMIAEKSSPALESFKAKVGGISEWFKNSKGQSGEDPAKAQEAMNEVMAKLKAISAEGVPEELKGAFQRYQAAMIRVQAMNASMPAQKEAAENWVMKNAEKLRVLEKDIIEAAKNLKEAAAKHGLTGLHLGTE